MKKGSPKSGTPTIEELSRCPEKCSYQDVIWRAEIREVSRSPADRFAAHTDRSPSHRREALDGVIVSFQHIDTVAAGQAVTSSMRLLGM